MQNPAGEIEHVVRLVATSETPDTQRDAVYKYYSEDAGLRHFVCSVPPGPNSREDILGVYQWYRVMSPQIQMKINSVIYDEERDILILDATQFFHVRLSPFEPAPARLTIRLSLRREGNLHYISFQEDFYHPDEFLNLLIPPLVPVLRFCLSGAGILSVIQAKVAQVMGYWRPGDEIPVVAMEHTGSEDSQGWEQPRTKKRKRTKKSNNPSRGDKEPVLDPATSRTNGQP